MKLQQATKAKRKGSKEVFVRARATQSLKDRLEGYARSIEASPAYIVRRAVTEFLDNAEKKAA